MSTRETQTHTYAPHTHTHTTYPTDDTLPVGATISGLVLLRQAFEVVDAEAVVARQHVTGQVALKAVPVVALCLPILEGQTQGSTELGDLPPSDQLPTPPLFLLSARSVFHKKGLQKDFIGILIESNGIHLIS